MIDPQTIERVLRNESDVAYKRRVRTMMEYLDPQPGERILDCGCGMGFYLRLLALARDEAGQGMEQGATRPFELVGIDGDAHQLGVAREALAGKDVLLVEGNILHMPFPDASFDKVLFTEVLEHLPDDRAGLAELWRVLKPGGTLALTVPQARYPMWYDPISRVAEGVFHKPIRTGPFAGIWANHFRLYTPQQVSEVVQASGYTIEDVRNLTHYCFPFTQTIVYTLGKGAIDHHLLPDFILRSTHRMRSGDNKGSALNPINWALALFNAFDRLNASDPSPKRTYVNVAIKARKGA